MDIREMGYEGGRWMELAKIEFQWPALVSAVLNLLETKLTEFMHIPIDFQSHYDVPVAAFRCCVDHLPKS
jgi:hypothetical protein